jgi:hypothetical protein
MVGVIAVTGIVAAGMAEVTIEATIAVGTTGIGTAAVVIGAVAVGLPVQW